MKFCTKLLATWAALVSHVAADFDLYKVYQTFYRPDVLVEVKVWQVFASPAEPPNCTEVQRTRHWSDRVYVDGATYGVRCVGKGCHLDEPFSNIPADDIDILEMSFGPYDLYHWSM